MPKVKPLPKKPKNKQKQKQKQSQRVVVNINTTTKKTARTKTTRTKQPLGYSYPVYLNSSNDSAPIIHNQPQYIPSQFSNIPTIAMPIHALNNVHIPPQITYPTPTELQTPADDIRILSPTSPASLLPRIPRLVSPSPSLIPHKDEFTGFNLGDDDFVMEREIATKAPLPIRKINRYTDEQKELYKRNQAKAKSDERRLDNLFLGREKKDYAKFAREMEVEGFLNQKPIKEIKKRGRPIGSKNKPKTSQEKMGPG